MADGSDADSLLDKLLSAVSEGDEKAVEDLVKKCNEATLEQCIAASDDLFIRICAQGFRTAAYYILTACPVKLSAKYNERTALQWACLGGHKDVVDLLLSVWTKKTLETPIWQETSEFYSACLAGNTEILDMLTVYFAEMIEGVEVAQALLYAACVGGHASLARRWYLPALDVNLPLQLVPSLQDCEHRTPLAAACQGRHKEVAELLLEHCGAEITEYVATQFPEFTAHLVDTVYQPFSMEATKGLFDLSSVKVHCIHPSWIGPRLSDITHMDLSRNKLMQLDTCVPWTLEHLVYLDISHNQLLKLPPPEHVEDIVCQRLEVVNASHNRLGEVCINLFQLPNLSDLNLSHNALRKLKESQPSRRTAGGGGRRWRWELPRLTVLDLSHNLLDILPRDDFKFRSLLRLDLSHNHLASLPSPWNCPLKYLDVSHNELERFPPSTEHIWSGSLTCLLVNHNLLDQLEENILKLGMLEKLNASHNRIQYLAPPHAWGCPSLQDLDLSHNCLGSGQKVNKRGVTTGLDFPSKLLSEELRTLNLSYNGLEHLPLSVCYIKSLRSLDMSFNLIQDLPKEMGNLADCWNMKFEGLPIKKPDLLKLIKNGKPLLVVEHLLNQLRDVQPCHTLKTLVIGPQGKGKTTTIESLVRGYMYKDVTLSNEPLSVTTYVMKAPTYAKIKQRTDKDRPDVILRLWEITGNPELLALHPVFWSENSLFLLAWDITEGASGLGDWLSNIKSRLEKVSVIIVATFKERIPVTEMDNKVKQFHTDINNMYSDAEEHIGIYPKRDTQEMFPYLSRVVCLTQHLSDVTQLREDVYLSALTMVKGKSNQQDKFVVGQTLPKSYLAVEAQIEKVAQQFKESDQPPFLTQKEFDYILQTVPSSDFHLFDDLQKAVNVWHEQGSIIHFDVWAEGLDRLYFLDATWLARMIAVVLRPPEVLAPHRQLLSVIDAQLGTLGFPSHILKPFLRLLKHFDIGAVQQGSLFLPCRLPRQAPGLEVTQSKDSCTLVRFYTMPHVPSRLWSRLILGLLLSLDRFAQLYWQSLKMEKPQMVYWQEGFNLRYSGGSIITESGVFYSSEEKRRYCGIRIYILTSSPTLADLAVIGFITDEIDSALLDIFPSYMHQSELFGTYALCPVCIPVQPSGRAIEGQHLHFSLAECAGTLLHDDYIVCPKGHKVALKDLVPEFLMGELPTRLLLSSEDIELKERLGAGAAGTVHRGILRGNSVAVKIFYQDTETATDAPAPPDSGISTSSSAGSVQAEAPANATAAAAPTEYGNFKYLSEMSARIQTERNIKDDKVCQAFTSARQEIVILSQLSHPCLISLLGVTLRPGLLVALELAPLGSLHSVIRGYMQDRPFNKHHYLDKDRTFGEVLNKDITFKIVHQIGLGLECLHHHNILYRDLKCDNVLVCSLDVADTINVKISDYGISKFTTSQGMQGMVGTIGYMAPEIMDGQSYDEKVDIFSFSMVIYELLTGHAPFDKCNHLHQLRHIINTERRRPSLEEYNIVASFPCLEELMQDMWTHDPHARPSASAVVSRMENVGFLLQHSELSASSHSRQLRANPEAGSTADDQFWNITCVWASKEIKSKGSSLRHNNCWVWESSSIDPIDRRLSIYDLQSGKLEPSFCKNCPGCPVTCMAQVGQFMWAGVQGCLVEIYSGSYTDLTKSVSKLEDFDADPVTIIHDKNNPNKDKLYADGEGFVYVGLSNGTVQIYNNYRKCRSVFSSEWHFHDVRNISTLPLQAVCLLRTRELLVVACGHSLVVLSTETWQEKKRLCLVQGLDPSFKKEVGVVKSVVVYDNAVLWCSFHNSRLIMEVETNTWTAPCGYRLQASLDRPIKRVSLGRETQEGARPCRACQGRSALPVDRTGASCKVVGEEESPGEEVERSEPLPQPPPRPPTFTKPASTSSLSRRTDDAERTAAGAPVDVSSVQLRLRAATNSDLQNCTQPADSKNCRLSARKAKIYSSSADKVGDSDTLGAANLGFLEGRDSVFTSNETSSTDSSDILPVLPPRRATSDVEQYTRTDEASAMGWELVDHDRSRTLPITITQIGRARPSTTTNKDSHWSGSTKLHIQSLLCFKDTLWVGLNSGEILIVGLRNQKSSSQSQASADTTTDSSSAFKSQGEAASSAIPRGWLCEHICTLKPPEDVKETGQQPRRTVRMLSLTQARDLVVGVHGLAPPQEEDSVAAITVWEAFDANTTRSIQHYWQAVRDAARPEI